MMGPFHLSSCSSSPWLCAQRKSKCNQKKRVTRRNNKLDYQYGPEQNGLCSDLLRQTTNHWPFLSKPITEYSYLHSLILEQKQLMHPQIGRIQNLHLAFHENLQRAQAFWLQCIHQRLNTYEGLALEVGSLSVHLIHWTSNPIPHRMQQCSFPSLCWTKDLWPNHPRIHNAVWNTRLWTVETTLAGATQRDWFSYQMISHTAGFKTFLHPHSMHPFSPLSGFPLLLFGTHSNHSRQHRCKALQPNPLILDTHSSQCAHPF